MQLMDIYADSMDIACEAHFASVDALTHPGDREAYAAESAQAMQLAYVAKDGAAIIRDGFAAIWR